MLTDLDRAGLKRYRSAYRAPDDFDAFWARTLDEQSRHPLAVSVTPVRTPLALIDVHEVSFAGYAGDPVHAWLRLPRDRSGPQPAVVQFHGYGSGRGNAVDDLVWAAAGYAQLVVDTRGQGAGHARGTTGDPVGSGPSVPGFLTRGIESRESYFYRRGYVDAVRAVQVVRTLDSVDASRVAAIGNSQGGGIALAVAGLVDDLAALYAQAPFLCDMRRASLITDEEPYAEIGRYLATHRCRVEQVFSTLSYFDGIAFAERATAPAWFSAGLMDGACPPSTTFGVHAVYGGPKQLAVWEYSGHEAGGSDDTEVVLAAFAAVLRPAQSAPSITIPGGTP